MRAQGCQNPYTGGRMSDHDSKDVPMVSDALSKPDVSGKA
jgi:hypothetical protein